MAANIKTLVDGGGSQILPRTWAKAVMTESGVTAEAKFAEIAGELGGISSAVGKAKPNIIGTYPVAEGETIAAGDVVDVVEGKIQKTVTPVENVELTDGNTNVTAIDVCVLTDKLAVEASEKSIGSIGISGAGQRKLGGTNFTSSGTITMIRLGRLTGASFVICYVNQITYGGDTANALMGKVCTVNSSGGISVNSGTTISSATVTSASIIPLTASSFLAVYNRSGLKAKVCTVSGTNISPGTEYPLSSITNATDISATILPDSGGNHRVCVCFADGGDGNKGKAVITTIDSANVVTWGTVVTFFDNNTRNLFCCEDNGDVIVTWADNNAKPNIVILSIDEAVITSVGTTLVLSGGGSSPIIKVGTSLACACSNGKALTLERSGTELSANNGYAYNDNASASFVSAAAVSAAQFIVAYADVANSDKGTTTILEVFGDQIAGSFTDESSQCIALQSGEAGQEIEVIFDGVAELPGAVAGQEITSPGVYGYCPKDGWLWVRPEWDKAPYVTGSYLGTGENTNMIQVGFTPSLVIVTEIKDDTGMQYAQIIMRYPAARANIVNSGSSATEFNISWAADGLTFSTANSIGFTYYYTAFR